MGVTLGVESIGHMECVYCRDGVCVLPLSFKGHQLIRILDVVLFKMGGRLQKLLNPKG